MVSCLGLSTSWFGLIFKYKNRKTKYTGMNENFQLRLHSQKSYESFFTASVRRRKIVLHCLLDEGSFVFNRLLNSNASQVLSIEVDKDIFDSHIKFVPDKLNFYSPGMALQLL